MSKKYGAVGKIKEKRRVNTEGEGERWISMQLGVWLDRYPFNNAWVLGLHGIISMMDGCEQI